MRDKAFEKKVFDYIKLHEHENIDLVNICIHFYTEHEKVVNTISTLRKLGYVGKQGITTLYYKYIIIKEYEN